MTDPAPPEESSARPKAVSFEEQAAAAGLVTPVRRRLNPWLAVGLIAVLVGASLGVGYATGWLNPTHPPPGPALYGPQDCTVTNVPIRGAVATDGGDLVAPSWQLLSGGFSNYTGGCVTLTLNTSGGADGIGAQSAKQVEYTLSALSPSAPALEGLGNSPLVVPVLLGGVGVVYDLPNLSSPLHLSGAILAGIFSGHILRWDDPMIAALNPGIPLPRGLPISVTYRNDSNPVTALFTDYLATVNATWNATVGSGSVVPWPTGMGEPSQASLLAHVGADVGAIGYAALPLTGTDGLALAAIENAAGEFVAPNATSVGAAAQWVGGSSPGADGAWSPAAFFEATAVSSYPLTSASYVLLYGDLGKAYSGSVGLPSAEWLLSFLWWVANEPSSSAGLLAPLPSAIIALAEGGLEKVLYNGTPVLSDNESGSEGGETGVF